MEYWEPTQRVLQGDLPLVKRPKLTETLLRKPPFRFLHDVISELCRQSGFAQGLFTIEELISTNIKEKESKVSYLWKIVDCVGITLNTNVPVRPLKIVAGLEPEQTNVFLQMLAAATMVDKQQSEKAVVRVLAGEKQPPSSHSGLEWIQLISDAMLGQDSVPTSEQPNFEDAGLQATQAKYNQSLSPSRLPDGNTKMGLAPTEVCSALPTSAMSDSGLKPACFASSEQEHLEGTTLESVPSHSNENLVSTLRSSEPPESEFIPTPHAVPRAIYNFSTELPPAISQRTNSKNGTPKRTRQNRPAVSPRTGSKIETTKQNGTTESSLTSLQAAISVLENARSGSSPPSCQEAQATTVTEDRVVPAPPPMCTTPRLSTAAVFPTISSLLPQRPQSARPQSARKAPPVIRTVLDKMGAKDLQGMLLERPASAYAQALQSEDKWSGSSAFIPIKKPNFLLDVELSDDEQENMPVLLSPPSMQETTVVTSVEGAGKLVPDILENRADLPEQAEVGDKIDGTEQIGIVLGQVRETCGRKADTQSRKEEIQTLREAVQTLCQIVNPLGKSVDHLQEDADIMHKEYKFWIKERDMYTIKVEEEKRITEEMLEAESDRVIQLDEEIKNQNQRIISLKAQIRKWDFVLVKKSDHRFVDDEESDNWEMPVQMILRNDVTILRLLRMVTCKTTRYTSVDSVRNLE